MRLNLFKSIVSVPVLSAVLASFWLLFVFDLINAVPSVINYWRI